MRASIVTIENCNFLEHGSCARYYNPETGRFLSEDPIRFLGGDANFYRYVSNQPVMINDPYGKNAAAGGTAFVCVLLTAGIVTYVAVEKKSVNECVRRKKGDQESCRKQAEKRNFIRDVIYIYGE